MAAKPTRVRTWTRPVVVITLLMALLSVMYLGYVVDPEKNLHDLPLAVVDQDVGDTLAGQPADVGRQITEALTANIPADKVDLRVVGITEAQRLLRDGKIYGAIVIPSDFTKRLAILGAASVVPGQVDRPVITVETNPRTGAYATQITLRIAEQALDQVNATVGRQLTAAVDEQLRSSGAPAPQPAGASRLLLAEPIMW
ncbi:YhgE/Pip domain-containing protein [Nocardia asiatica]|uniref:YhgE/Pip domain-containing protein n=1 Tax=Nocardia asiatica TaxID=209252 RepID=UPI003EE30C6C